MSRINQWWQFGEMSGQGLIEHIEHPDTTHGRKSVRSEQKYEFTHLLLDTSLPNTAETRTDTVEPFKRIY